MILILLLTGCARVNSSPAPDLFGYTKQQQSNAADALEKQECAPLGDFMVDYMKVRDQIRAIKND